MEKENIKKRHSLNCILCKLPVIFPSVFLFSPSFLSFPVSCVLRMMLPLCEKGKILGMRGDTGFPFAHLLLIFSSLSRRKTFRNIYDMQG